MEIQKITGDPQGCEFQPNGPTVAPKKREREQLYTPCSTISPPTTESFFPGFGELFLDARIKNINFQDAWSSLSSLSPSPVGRPRRAEEERQIYLAMQLLTAGLCQGVS